MTISSTTTKNGPYVGNSAATSFSFTFKVFTKTEITVTKTTSDVDSVLTLDSDYSVSLNSDQNNNPGGTITYPITGSPMTADSSLVISRNVAFTQGTDLLNAGNWNPDSVENMADKAMMAAQQLSEQLGRCLSIPIVSSDGVDTSLPAPQANKFFAWNSLANALVPYDVSDLTGSYTATTIDTFVGGTDYTAGTTDELTLSVDPGDEANLLVTFDGLVQHQSTFTQSLGVITFDAAIPVGTLEVQVKIGKTAPLGVTTTNLVTHQPAGLVSRTVESKLSEIVTPEDYGAVGDGVTIDTDALQDMLTNVSDGAVILVTGTYLTDHLKMIGKSDITFLGKGTLKTIPTLTNQYYSSGAILNLIACENIKVELVFDGNRAAIISTTPSTVGMNHGVGIWPADVETSAIFSNNYGESKPSRNINLSGSEFYNLGTTGVSGDLFGDGFYAFACDGLLVEHAWFYNMGRWGGAWANCFNVRVGRNYLNNPVTENALGAFDYEDEGIDDTNGNYSRDTRIYNNHLIGRCVIHAVVRVTAGNDNGTYHYSKNTEIIDNDFTFDPYSLFGIGDIPIVFNIATIAGTPPSFICKELTISGNKMRKHGATDFGTGVRVYPQCVNSASDITLVGITIENNVVQDASDYGIDVYASVVPTVKSLRIKHNNILHPTGSDSGTGIRAVSDLFEDIDIDDNVVEGYGTYGLLLVHNTGPSTGRCNRNTVREGGATFSGTAISANVSLDSLQDNVTEITSGTQKAGVATVERNNTWNSEAVTYNPGTVTDGTTDTKVKASVTGLLFGQRLTVSAPYDLQGCTATAYVSAADELTIVLDNHSGGDKTFASGSWTVRWGT